MWSSEASAHCECDKDESKRGKVNQDTCDQESHERDAYEAGTSVRFPRGLDTRVESPGSPQATRPHKAIVLVLVLVIASKPRFAVRTSAGCALCYYNTAELSLHCTILSHDNLICTLLDDNTHSTNAVPKKCALIN